MPVKYDTRGVRPLAATSCKRVACLPGVAPNNGAFAMLDLIVSVTLAPRSTAPRNSQIPAIMQACQILRALEPTLVPKELATSFAPIPADRQPQFGCCTDSAKTSRWSEPDVGRKQACKLLPC